MYTAVVSRTICLLCLQIGAWVTFWPSIAHAAPSSEAPDRLPKGTEFTVTALHPRDSYSQYPEMIGIRCTSGNLHRNDGPWFGGPATCGDKRVYFYMASFDFDPATIPEPEWGSTRPYITLGLPLGYGGDSTGSGFVYGINGTLALGLDSPFALSTTLAIAGDGRNGGLLTIGLRYQSRKLVWAEVGFGGVKTMGYPGGGFEAGVGAHVPLGNTAIAVVPALQAGYSLDTSTLMWMVTASPTIWF